MTFDGSNYIELRYKSSTVDAVGTTGVNNFSTLGNRSLYRNSSVNDPVTTFDTTQWTQYPVNYCDGIGILAVSDVNLSENSDINVYPNPVTGAQLFLRGNHISSIRNATILDLSGKILRQESNPFKGKNSISVEGLSAGIYLLKVDDKAFKFIKK